MNRTSGHRRLARKVAMVATALGLWGALVLLFAAPLALTGQVSWRQAVSFGGSFWALWLLFLPGVAWFSFRFPIVRRRLLRNVGLHLLACLLVVGTNRATFRAAARIFPRPERSDAPWPPPPGSKLDRLDPLHQLGHLPLPRPQSPDPDTNRLGPPAVFGEYFARFPRFRKYLTDTIAFARQHGYVRVFFGLRAALDVLVYGSLVGVCQAITNFRSSQERERRAAELEARFTSAKLQALRMQINPHFLFNTLNSIAALVYVNPRAADEMLGDLSELLRRSLDSMEEHEVPLSQELEFIGTYLSIEQKRFGERLRLEQSVPDELMNVLVPSLILQPLIENAIRHGIEPRRGPGLISIEAKQEEKQLHLIVRDNGRGLTGADVNSPGRRGIGLANIRARLRGLYGPDQSFSLGRAEPQGCQVDIHLPFHLEPPHVPVVSNEPAL
jgi:two-component sensor histidine kinase